MLNRTYVYGANVLNAMKEKAVSKLRSENGMEMLQMIILIGVALMLGTAVMLFLKAYVGNSNAGFWSQFKTKLNNIIG